PSATPLEEWPAHSGQSCNGQGGRRRDANETAAEVLTAEEADQAARAVLQAIEDGPAALSQDACRLRDELLHGGRDVPAPCAEAQDAVTGQAAALCGRPQNA